MPPPTLMSCPSPGPMVGHHPEGLTFQQVREWGAAVAWDRVVPLPDVLKQLVDVVPLEGVQACCDVVASPPRGRTEAQSVGACPAVLAQNPPGTKPTWHRSLKPPPPDL